VCPTLFSLVLASITFLLITLPYTQSNIST